MLTEKNFFLQIHDSFAHSFAKDKVISTCKNDKPWKN